MEVFNWRPLKEKVSEQISTFSFQLGAGWNTLRRSFWTAWEGRAKGSVNFTLVRELYRNDMEQSALGAGFCKPIIDLSVEFMGIPRAASGDEDTDEFLSMCFQDYWAPQLNEMKRNAMRDSITTVRMRKPGASPLTTPDEARYCRLEIISPETCDVYYNSEDSTIIDMAVIKHEIVEVLEDRDVQSVRVGNAYQPPRTEVKIIYEEITPTEYRYYDETIGEWRNDLRMDNTWGFVPILEVFNEWDDTAKSGICDFETAMPFIQSFHEVFKQTLSAHKYHSVPKATFKVTDVMQFIVNNFPDSFAERGADGRPDPASFTGTINWRGTEILFFQPDEGAEFLEAKSVLGDSKTLLEFLLDCICISSETPEWAFMRVEGAGTGRQTAQTLPFVRKVQRKRLNFQDAFQKLGKMVLAANKRKVVCVPLDWEEITVDDLLAKAQALNFITMSMEVAAQRGVVSDTTYRETLRPMVPAMKPPTEEAREAEKNVNLGAEVNATQNGQGGGPIESIGQQGRQE